MGGEGTGGERKRKGGTGKGRGGRKGERKREGEEEGRIRDVPPPQFQLLDPPVLHADAQ